MKKLINILSAIIFLLIGAHFSGTILELQNMVVTFDYTPIVEWFNMVHDWIWSIEPEMSTVTG